MQFTFTVDEKVATTPEFYRKYADFLESLHSPAPVAVSAPIKETNKKLLNILGDPSFLPLIKNLMGVKDEQEEVPVATGRSRRRATTAQPPTPETVGILETEVSLPLLVKLFGAKVKEQKPSEDEFISLLKSLRPIIVDCEVDLNLQGLLSIWDKAIIAVEKAKAEKEFEVQEFATDYITSIIPELVSSGLLTKVAKAFEMYPESMKMFAPLLAMYLR